MKPALVALSVFLLLPQQTFRSGVNVVPVYPTVVDRGGRFVPDLTAADFEITDNGRPQQITVFQSGTMPITMALMVDESPSVFASSDRMITAVAGVREALPARGPRDDWRLQSRHPPVTRVLRCPGIRRGGAVDRAAAFSFRDPPCGTRSMPRATR